MFKNIISISLLFLILLINNGCSKNDSTTYEEPAIEELVIEEPYIDPKWADDPYLRYQWYLVDTDETIMNKSGVAPIKGNDLNISDVWNTYTGYNNGNPIKIQIVDNGVDVTHRDLIDNIDTVNAYSYNTSDNNVSPTDLSNDAHAHGTKVAGIAAAVGWNGIGIRGVAPKASIVPFRLKTVEDLSGEIYSIDADVIDKAFVTAPISNEIAISSNSWGICYDQSTFFDDSMGYAANNLRDGKGKIFVAGSGNARRAGCYTLGGDTSANGSRLIDNPYVITVASINYLNEYSWYSQGGANVFISAYGGGLNDIEPAIATTSTKESFNDDSFSDDAESEYTSFQGTSAAAPIVSGGIALVLEACPNLSYRDVQYVMAKTAIKIDDDDIQLRARLCTDGLPCSDGVEKQIYLNNIVKTSDNHIKFNTGSSFIEAYESGYDYSILMTYVSDQNTTATDGNHFVVEPIPEDALMWKTNAAGLSFNNNYGFGKLNVSGMIDMCTNNYSNLGVEQSYDSGVIVVGEVIDDGVGLDSRIDSDHFYIYEKDFTITDSFKTRWVGFTYSAELDMVAVRIELISPSGTKIKMQEFNGTFSDKNEEYRLGTYAFMDEDVNGTWTVKFSSWGYNATTLNSVGLNILGY